MDNHNAIRSPVCVSVQADALKILNDGVEHGVVVGHRRMLLQDRNVSPPREDLG